MGKNHWIMLSILGALALLLLLLLSMGKIVITPRQNITVADCDAAKYWCTSSGGVALQLGDGSGINTLQPFLLTAQLNDEAVTTVAVKFSMQGMDMGENRYRLNYSAEDALWQAEVVLPLCTQGRQQWLATLIWQQSDAEQRLDFPFTTQ